MVRYSEFLNYFDPDTHLQISLVTRRVDEAEFRRDTFLPLRGDARDRYSEEMNRVISEKALQGQNGLIREKYITISLHVPHSGKFSEQASGTPCPLRCLGSCGFGLQER